MLQTECPLKYADLPEVVQAPDVAEKRNDMLHVSRLGRVHLAWVQAAAISAPAEAACVQFTCTSVASKRLNSSAMFDRQTTNTPLHRMAEAWP